MIYVDAPEVCERMHISLTTQELCILDLRRGNLANF